MKKKDKGSSKPQPDLEVIRVADKVEVYSTTTYKDINYPLLVCYIKSHMLDKKVEVGRKFTVGLFGENAEFVVGRVLPEDAEGVWRVNTKTSIILLEEKP